MGHHTKYKQCIGLYVQSALTRIWYGTYTNCKSYGMFKVFSNFDTAVVFFRIQFSDSSVSAMTHVQSKKQNRFQMSPYLHYQVVHQQNGFGSEYVQNSTWLKGQIVYSVFFIKPLLLVPLETPRKDFEYFWIFEKFFLFVIDSPVYSPPGKCDSLVYSSPGSWDSPVYSPPGIQPKLVYKRTLLVQNMLGSQTPMWLIHWGVLTP